MTEHAPVYLVTGAARRIGASIARALHERGVRVVLHARQSISQAHALCDALNQMRPDSAVVQVADLADVAACQQLIRAAAGHWGQLDGLINNASAFYPSPLGSVDEADWDDLFAANLKAPFFLVQEAAPWLAKQAGSVVNITDIHAERPMKGHSVYCAAKAGLLMLTRSLARELAPTVRVNAVAPGAILWPESDAPDAAQQRTWLDRIPLRSSGEPEDIARTVCFLALDAAYVTGQVLAVDGGRSVQQ